MINEIYKKLKQKTAMLLLLKLQNYIYARRSKIQKVESKSDNSISFEGIIGWE